MSLNDPTLEMTIQYFVSAVRTAVLENRKLAVLNSVVFNPVGVTSSEVQSKEPGSVVASVYTFTTILSDGLPNFLRLSCILHKELVTEGVNVCARKSRDALPKSRPPPAQFIS